MSLHIHFYPNGERSKSPTIFRPGDLLYEKHKHLFKGLDYERRYFKAGLEYVMDKLEPAAVVIYGAAPDEIFAPYRERGIELLQFASDFMQSRKVVKA